jgi:hypothetical protein
VIWARRVVVGLVAALAVVAVAVAASAALDAPSRSFATLTTIDAPREEVWSIVTDFESYPRWNPYMRSVRGRAALGETLDVRLAPPGGEEDEVSAEVFVYKPPRKLRWQSRLVVPGLRDVEYEVIVAPAGPNRAQVVQRIRYEGLLAPFVEGASAQSGLESMARALERRAEASEG